jgi:hypothetical protein
MPTKVWTFSLDGAEHTVELEYDLLSAKETFTVDGEAVFSGSKWSLTSRYEFKIGDHACRVALYALRNYQAELKVDGQPVELLPSNRLLRPTAAGGQDGALLRPAGNEESAPSAGLLRPSEPQDDA